MRDKHPIDDLFREALLRASVEPPPHLAEAILGAAQRRRRGFLWLRRRYVLAGLLLGLTAGGVGLWVLGLRSSDAPARTVAMGPTDTVVSDASALSTDDTTEQRNTLAVEGGGEGSPSDPNGPVPAPKAKPTRDVLGGYGPARDSSPMQPATMGDLTTTPPEPQGDGVGQPPSLPVSSSSEYGTEYTRTSLELLSPRPIAAATSAGTLAAAPVDPYVLGAGDWWFGVGAGAFASQRQWAGSPAALTDALNASEAWNSTLAIGAMGGRSWRSGMGLGVGLECERSEQAYRHVERTTSYESVVNTQMVTLNTLVLYSSSDTVVTPTQSERVSAGTDKRTVWRIPVEAFWRVNLGRWFVGARLGVAGEFTRVNASASLVNDEVLGGVGAAALTRSELDQRYPFTVVGVAGADLGFFLHEHWTLSASPLYMKGLFHGGGGNTVTSSPERAGARFQLCYIL